MNPNLIEATWKQGSTVAPVNLTGAAFQQEAGAHTFRITCLNDDGSAASVSGTVTAEVLRSDGVTRVVTGSISGNVVVATLTSGCYECPGRVTISIKVTENASKTICVYQCHASVARTKSDTEYVDTGTRIPDLASLTQAEEDAEAAAQAANTAASAADTARLALQDTIDTAINAAGYPYTASGSSVTIHPVADSRIDFIAHIDPIQTGSGDPSPSNVRPITAPESVTIRRCGENLLGATATSTSAGVTFTAQNDGSLKIEGTATGAHAYYAFISWSKIQDRWTAGFEGKELRFTSGADGVQAKIAYRADSSSPTTESAWAKTVTAILPTDSSYQIYIALRVYNGTTVNTKCYPKIMLASETDTGMDEYTAQDITITLPSGTYCGEYDSRTGTVTRAVSAVIDGTSHKAASVNTSASTYGTIAYTNIYPYRDLSLSAMEVRRTVATDLHCSHAITVSNMTVANEVNRDKVSVSYFSGSEVTTYVTLAFYFPASMNITTVEAANAWFAANTPTVTYYPNSISQRVQTLSPSTLRAASPAQLNHVWANNGSITVTGPTDLKWLIDSLHPNG